MRQDRAADDDATAADPTDDATADDPADGPSDTCRPVTADPDDFGAAVTDVVRAIPPGYVMTYGDVAAALGSRASRAVGKVMALEGSALPWWRVIRSGGLPPVRHEARALEHYRAEGTPVVQGRTTWHVDLRTARWSPDDDPRDDPDFPRDPF